MTNLKFYFHGIKVYLYSLMEYRFSFITSIFLQIFTYSIMILNIWILLNKFEEINGWTFYELLFLYTLNLLSYAISGMFIKHPMLAMEKMVQDGSFDSILTKPINPLFHVIARQFEYTFLGHIILCIITLTWSIHEIDIVFTPIRIVIFALFVIGAILIQAAFMIISGSMCFFTIKSVAVVETAIHGLRNFLEYPISIFNRSIQIIITFILPYAFVNYYPAEYFLRKTDPPLFSSVLYYMTPIVGGVLFVISLGIWSIGIKHYTSTGS